MPRRIAIALIAALLAPTPCLAWGAEGHQIIAHIAARELTPAARAQVQAMLDGEAEAAMVTVSTWADEVRLMARTGEIFGLPGMAACGRVGHSPRDD